MKFLRWIAAALTIAVTLAGCSGQSGDTSDPITKYNAAGNVLNIVAGSEQDAVFGQIVKPWCNSQKITCNLTKMGSVDQARLLQGDASKVPYDAFWFASKVFAQLGDQRHILQDTQPMFTTPVVFAGWKSEMERLGFTGRDVKIQEVLDAVQSGKTKTWITNPTQSNSGATVLFGFLNHFAGNGPGTALTAQQLGSPKVQQGVTQFAHAFDHTPPSTGTLMDECVANPNECKTVFTYEALAIEYNKRLVAAGKEPLYVVYPQGSLAISDAPFGFLPHGDNAEKRQNFKKLQAYLLSGEAQQKLVALGRRPITSIGLNLQGAPTSTFNPAWGIRPTLHEQPITYPAGSVIQTALDNYQTIYRRPTDAYYCLDGSGSMADNGGWDGVKDAATLLFDPEESKKYLLQVNPQDRTSVDIFNSGQRIGIQRVDGNNPDQLRALKDKIRSTDPDGGTGIYRCLGRAANHFKSTPAGGRKQLLVLMTDGQDTEGGESSVATITGMNIPVITIGFGDSDEGTLRRIANQTHGAFIGSDNLVDALRQATGYK